MTTTTDKPGIAQDLDAAQQHVAAAVGKLELLKAAGALDAGDFGLAEQLGRSILKRDPRNVAAMRLLAEVAMAYGRFDDAEDLLDYALELAPAFQHARHSYANLLFRTMRYDEAIVEVDSLLRAEPGRASALLLRASIHSQTGRTHDAIDSYDAVLQQHPDQARIQLGKGHALKTIGRQSEAIAAYCRAIELQPGLGEAYWSLSNLKTFRFDDNLFQQMQRLLADEPDSPQDYFHLAFAFAKALEDRGKYDEAFQWYANGNAARRRTVHWDADKYHDDLAKVAAYFQPQVFEQRSQSGDPSTAPIFIVGMPRAGSTLLEQILASHSLVDGTMELGNIMAIARRLSRQGMREKSLPYPDVLSTMSDADLADLGAEYLERAALYRAGAPFFIDKMPNNFAHIGLIRLILPNAKVLDARRRPMACCFGVFKQLFANRQNFSYSLEEIGRYYRDYVQLMAHWNSVQPGYVLRVDYEAVVENTEDEVRRVLDFCGLDFEPGCLEFHRNRRAVRTASSEQVRQPIYTTAIEHWCHFANHLAPLKKVLR